MMPTLPKVIDPQKIVARAKGDMISQLNDNNDDDNDSDNGDSAINHTIKSTSSTTQLGLAYEAVIREPINDSTNAMYVKA